MKIKGRIATIKVLPKGVNAEEKPQFEFVLQINGKALSEEGMTEEEYHRLIQAKEKKEGFLAEVELSPDQGDLFNKDGGKVQGSEE